MKAVKMVLAFIPVINKRDFYETMVSRPDIQRLAKKGLC